MLFVSLTQTFIFSVILVPLFIGAVLADYDCVCNYNVEESVLATPAAGSPIGYLYEFDCKPQAGPDSGNYYQIMYEKQVLIYYYIHLLIHYAMVTLDS